ncbi:hypothetical protein WG899_14145 [Paucibacter sp. AS339]|uniref:hypothetical protein n=1 Tax=Paucibacter hankyongi TaxID=3133434 RepID=UPI0030B1AF77
MNSISSHAQRLERYAKMSCALALLSDQQRSRLVDGAMRLGCGVGGSRRSPAIDGCLVLATRVRLTE